MKRRLEFLTPEVFFSISLFSRSSLFPFRTEASTGFDSMIEFQPSESSGNPTAPTNSSLTERRATRLSHQGISRVNCVEGKNPSSDKDLGDGSFCDCPYHQSHLLSSSWLAGWLASMRSFSMYAFILSSSSSSERGRGPLVDGDVSAEPKHHPGADAADTSEMLCRSLCWYRPYRLGRSTVRSRDSFIESPSRSRGRPGEVGIYCQWATCEYIHAYSSNQCRPPLSWQDDESIPVVTGYPLSADGGGYHVHDSQSIVCTYVQMYEYPGYADDALPVTGDLEQRHIPTGPSHAAESTPQPQPPNRRRCGGLVDAQRVGSDNDTSLPPNWAAGALRTLLLIHTLFSGGIPAVQIRGRRGSRGTRKERTWTFDMFCVEYRPVSREIRRRRTVAN
ncbi:hypothetical protein BZA05DRAFT_434287 [Tricharina praecox]|uniref:uncharacterized protein n=1 Tax=Tricharina praecox TaxID=43433 RepID=UPI00221F5E76|nr:uncharacterized protein BZA05DRAFT_434287 [Tricharina praecox]KAI5855813.1 hypothetical protein BZA05DRAFT_434287 [Tricharina praecox]